MLWLVAHTPDGLEPDTFHAVMEHVPASEQVRFHPIDNDPYEYGRVLADLWAKGAGLVVVEQDVVIRPDVVDAFLTCPEPWCCFPYELTTFVGPALGCSRFTAGFLADHPTAMAEACEHPGGYGAGHYRSVDFALFRDVLALGRGVQPHCHLPIVEHLNPAQKLRPDVDPAPVLEITPWYGVGKPTA